MATLNNETEEPASREGLIKLIQLMAVSIEGLCSGIKSDPTFLRAYNKAIDVLEREMKNHPEDLI